MDISEHLLNTFEYVPTENHEEIAVWEKAFIQDGLYEEPNEDFSWILDPKISKNTYFCMINCARTTIKAGSQVPYFYGKRTN